MPVIFSRGGGPGCGHGHGRGGGGGCLGSGSYFSPISAGRECATGTKKKMQKSSNERDSCLCGIVVLTSLQLHATATQAQAILAAADAPAVPTVTSVATVPVATSDAAITAFTECDKNIEFNLVLAARGGGADSDELRGEAVVDPSCPLDTTTPPLLMLPTPMEFCRIKEATTATATLWMCLHLLLQAQ
jgi:hypothetical protein